MFVGLPHLRHVTLTMAWSESSWLNLWHNLPQQLQKLDLTVAQMPSLEWLPLCSASLTGLESLNISSDHQLAISPAHLPNLKHLTSWKCFVVLPDSQGLESASLPWAELHHTSGLQRLTTDGSITLPGLQALRQLTSLTCNGSPCWGGLAYQSSTIPLTAVHTPWCHCPFPGIALVSPLEHRTSGHPVPIPQLH